jgi:hypothetical protein
MKWLLILSMLTLTACGSTSNVKVNAQSEAKSSFVLIDSRPDEQINGKIDYSDRHTKYYSDKMIRPTPPKLLEYELQNKIGNKLNSKNVILKNFIVTVYDGSLYGGSHFEVKPSEIPLAIIFAPLIAIAAIEAGADGVNETQLISTSIEIEIDNKSYYGSASNEHKGHVDDAQVSTTISKALTELSRNIKGQMEFSNAP